MKTKSIKTFIFFFIIMVFSFFFSTNVKPKINAALGNPLQKFSGTPSTSYDNFLKSYFENLTENFAENVLGTCGYVAMEMLLMYYNTFLNDNIVPSQYEYFTPTHFQDMSLYVDSPGSLNDLSLVDDYLDMDYTTINCTNYYNDYIIYHINDSLHAKLCSIAYNHGINTFLGFINFGTEQNDLYNILNYYFLDEIGLSSSDYTLPRAVWYNTTIDQNNCKDYIMDLIDDGYPVIVGLENPSNPNASHYAIAYDYDSTTNKIFCNYGYHDNGSLDNNHRDYTIDNYYISDTIYINFTNKHHSHSYQYKILDSMNIVHSFCYDSPYIYTYNHYHSDTYRYDYYNQSYHKGICQCEDSYTLRSHVVDINATGQYADCLLCGGIIDIWQNPIIGMQLQPLYSMNGSILLPNGIIKLHPLDFDAYINGSLLFGDDLYA